jgi:transcriptional regulator with XRE-family HTH domain
MFDIVDDPRPPRVQAVLAANLRRLRIARHLSLSELARTTAIGKATLSSIENGRANPTVETLAGLAAMLHVSIGELLEEPPVGEIRVVRASSRSGRRRNSGIEERTIDAITFAAGGSAALLELALDAGQLAERPPAPPASRAHLFVTHGTLIAGPAERITELGAGDYVSFPADVPHQYEAAGRSSARALILMSRGP